MQQQFYERFLKLCNAIIQYQGNIYYIFYKYIVFLF